MKKTVTVVLALLAFLTCTFWYAHAGDETLSNDLPPVVSTDWLAEHLADPDLITLHMGPPGSYEERHIPGARSASLRRMIRVNEAGVRDEMLPAGDIAEAFSELGIGNSSRVVVYFSEEGIAWGVARYLLTLEYAGMTGRVAYLDGGLPKWMDEKRPVTSEGQSVEVGTFTPTTCPDVLVGTDWLSARINQPGISVIDGRPEEGYSGLSGHWDRLGHIPGAVNIPFFTLMSEDPPYLLKSRDELLAMFKEAGVNPGDTVVAYCGTGLWGSLPYLAARHLGFEARLYDGSYQEWSATENLPIVASAKSDDSD